MDRDGDDAVTLEKTTHSDPTSADPEPIERGPASSWSREGTGPGLASDRYRIVERLAQGGMGEVLIAYDQQIGRTVAIKRMRTSSPSERQVRRFLREARIQGRLAHPAVCKVHEIGVDEAGVPFFVMERLEGVTLAEMLARGLGADRLRVLRAFVEVCLAVELAHTRGIVHRDLKPENIMLGNFGEVFVIDWGVAKVLGEAGADEFADIGSGEYSENATAVGTIIGTPGYMAPEQVRGIADIDARADVYALGCVLFEILTGDPVHPAGRAGLESTLAGGMLRPSARAGGREIPPELDASCAAALETDRELRLRSARELGDRVQRYLDGDRDLAQRRELARIHLDRAHGAFTRGDDSRAMAMREAGRALALDPTLAPAAELVTRLMLEPPAAVPAEVEEAIELDNRAIERSNARFGMFAYLAFLGFSPLLWVIAPGAVGFITVITVLIVANATMLWRQSHAARPRPVVVAACNAVMVAVVGRMFTPFLIAPAIAALIAMGIVVAQRMTRLHASLVIGGMLSAAVLAPWLLELVGVLSTTTSLTPGGMLLDGVGIGRSGHGTLIVAALWVVLLIAVACALGDAMRNRERAAKRHILLQAWQLKQLVGS